jgi:uncharacterized membrane protein YbhN (UPF0104 family)
MTPRRALIVFASVVLAILLIVVLVIISKIDLRVTQHQLQGVTWLSLAQLLLLNGLLVYISSEKWRSIDAAWRHSSDSALSRMKSMALTALGLGLGLVLPVQIAMSTARTLGTYVHGRPMKRGTAGTLLEQSFDLLVVAFLSIASGTTWLFGGGSALFIVSAVAMAALALLAVGPLMRVIRWLAATYSTKLASQHNRISRALAGIQHPGLLNASLARRLVVLSLARYAVIVLMSVQTAEAIGEHIPIWHMAAAIPFVVVASVIALTPGGLGVNELTSAAALKAFGTPLAIGAQWALGNRVLISVSYSLVAACAAIVLLAEKYTALRERDPPHERTRREKDRDLTMPNPGKVGPSCAQALDSSDPPVLTSVLQTEPRLATSEGKSELEPV